MIECSQCGWTTEEDLDLWSDPMPTCPKCGSSELQYLREKNCERYCCLNCDRFREMVFPMIAEMIEDKVREILREGSSYHG